MRSRPSYCGEGEPVLSTVDGYKQPRQLRSLSNPHQRLPSQNTPTPPQNSIPNRMFIPQKRMFSFPKHPTAPLVGIGLPSLRISLLDTTRVAASRFPKAYESLPRASDLHFFEACGGTTSLLLGRLLIDFNGTKRIVRDIVAILSPCGSRITIAFAENGAFQTIRDWDTIAIQYCAPFSLFNKKDRMFKQKMESFIKFCFLISGVRERVTAGLEFMVDLREVAEDVGWNWKMWKEAGGKSVKEFLRETRAADLAVAREREKMAAEKMAKRKRQVMSVVMEEEEEEEEAILGHAERQLIYQTHQPNSSELLVPRDSTLSFTQSEEGNYINGGTLRKGLIKVFRLHREAEALNASREETQRMAQEKQQVQMMDICADDQT